MAVHSWPTDVTMLAKKKRMTQLPMAVSYNILRTSQVCILLVSLMAAKQENKT